ncbi:hypothetical protein CVD28_02645 [Bacillus sp. M6-12]|uniref:hypothetical protein n=1 Tax=Bacillus sp. M6-12 TaxID=2054166 RepID=UPI000C76FC2C|nr:hypothetical protein [Bacillus sp. M6-12]PLS19331.1 hypothetical protein CVD28_02645 [Bacillus sp. M6-12]
MKQLKRVQEQIKLESSLPSEIFKKVEELREQGYSFEPMSNYMNEENQRVYFMVGTKSEEWGKVHAKDTKLSIIYFGGSVGVYLNNELYTYRQYRDCGIEDLFNSCLELMTKNIQRVEKFGISDESEFWDTVNHSFDWIPPLNFDTFKKYCISI